MSNSAINTQVAQLKIGNVQNQADNSAVYSGGVWSLKNSTALTSVTITDAGNVGVGVTPSAWSPSAKAIELGVRGSLFFESTGGNFFGIANNSYYDGTNYRYKQTAAAAQLNLGNDGSFNFLRAASGTAGNAITYTESMRIDANGRVAINTTSGGNEQFSIKGWTNGYVISAISPTTSTAIFQVESENSGTTPAVAGTLRLAKGTNNRSVNASGTINANGADYAEYISKAGDFTIIKGEICGINADGKLVKTFSEAVAFVVKSTNPSYVGNDNWFTEQRPCDENEKESLKDSEQFKAWESRMEAARQLVDRIAFCGQVPVNVLGATPGQWIIPVEDNGGIKGEAVSSPSFEQYQKAVGKVIAIEEDGRARIIVKIA